MSITNLERYALEKSAKRKLTDDEYEILSKALKYFTVSECELNHE